jgi:hypothetical protein
MRFPPLRRLIGVVGGLRWWRWNLPVREPRTYARYGVADIPTFAVDRLDPSRYRTSSRYAYHEIHSIGKQRIEGFPHQYVQVDRGC